MRLVISTPFGLDRRQDDLYRQQLPNFCFPFYCNHYLLLFFSLLAWISPATASTDLLTSLGLPRRDACTFAYNQSLYILGGSMNNNNKNNTTPSALSLNFGDTSTVATHAPMVTRLGGPHNNNNNNSDGIMNTTKGCVVTSYGQAILLFQNGSLSALDLATFQFVAMPALGSDIDQNNEEDDPENTIAVDRITLHDDQLIAMRDNETYILDASIVNDWAWYALPADVFGSPPPRASSGRSVLIATAHWVLHFAAANNATFTEFGLAGRPYRMVVHCFDPRQMRWLGQIGEFASPTDTVLPALLVNTTDPANDHLLIVPALSGNASASDTRRNWVEPPIGLWTFTVAADNATNAMVSYVPPSRIGPFRPMAGGSVTTVNNLVVMYGGLPMTHDALRIWDQTHFAALPWWENTAVYTPSGTQHPTEAESSNEASRGHGRLIGIVVGCVLGGLLLLCLLALAYICCRRRRRRRKDQDKEIVREISAPLPAQLPQADRDDAGTWASQLQRTLSAHLAGRRPSLNQLDPGTCASHAAGGAARAAPPAAPEMTPEEEAARVSSVKSKSRFIENFDLRLPFC
ncbi:hypothetical protein BCR43DRAFT_484963 [Syncephalastrum racemosum]|uniref:Uncharacterized protein n=1 Tax=Syncephalastrum racemosum TaxID=13706 RepID=A0A1X2HLP9_SYNRA|nr:hypothetical protein BCR43DRAFT_484963 [Syncephalastrum racemosum]